MLSGHSTRHEILPDVDSLWVSLGLQHPVRSMLVPLWTMPSRAQTRDPELCVLPQGRSGLMQQREHWPCPGMSDRRTLSLLSCTGGQEEPGRGRWMQAVGLCFLELGQGASFAEPTVSFSVSSGQMLSENQFKCHFPWGASFYPLPAYLIPLFCMHHGRVCAPGGWCSPFSLASSLLLSPTSTQGGLPLPSSPRF